MNHSIDSSPLIESPAVHAGVSFWLDRLERPAVQRRDLPRRCDAVVIGGGITGVSAAYWLRRLGLTVALLERGELASGATGRNGGHLVIGPNLTFDESASSLGIEETLNLWRFTRQCAAEVKQFVEEHGIDCDLKFNRFVTLALTPEQAADLRRNYDQMAPHGLAADFWDAQAVAQNTHSSYFKAALVEPDHAQLWPAKLVLGIAQVAAQHGAVVLPHTPVTAVQRPAGGFRVVTPAGAIETGAVIYATNAYTYHLLPELKGLIVPVRGQAIATEPCPRLWDFDWLANDGYEYVIQRQDGRIILGGMRRCSPTEEVGTEDDTRLEPNVSRGLRQFSGDAFGPLRQVKIDYEWTGIMGYSCDRNPLVGELPQRPGEYIAAGYTGHGMSLAFLSGKALAERVAGQPTTPIPQAFDPARYFTERL